HAARCGRFGFQSLEPNLLAAVDTLADAPPLQSQHRGLDAPQRVRIAIDVEQVEIHDGSRQGFITCVPQSAGDLEVRLIVRALESGADFVPELPRAVSQASFELRCLLLIECHPPRLVYWPIATQ